MKPHALAALLLLAAGPAAALEIACPAHATFECDGAGNVAERAAWLDAFTPTAGCDPMTESLTLIPGEFTGDITYDEFCDVSDFTFNGSAAATPHPVVSGGRCVLRLTDGLMQSGSVFLTNPVSLGPAASFSTLFLFRIQDPQGSVDTDGVQGADGLTFVVQTVSSSTGGVGGGIGYEGLPDSVAVELDTWNNGLPDEDDGNHVGIDVEGVIDSVVQAHVVQPFNDGSAWRVWVDYDGASDVLEARVSPTPIRPALPSVVASLDLPAILGTTDAFLGFTSGTGSAGGDHEILEWIFNDAYAPFGCAGTGTETAIYHVNDGCGDHESCTRTVTIVDTLAPELTIGPVEACHPDLDAATAAVLAASTATDLCSASPRLAVVGATATGCDALITVRATDDCGLFSEQSVSTTLDTDAPTITPGTTITPCAWPPNHAYACFGASSLGATVADACGDVTWRIVECASDQPDDGLGDGRFTDDCTVSGDRICVRSERQGMVPAGRTYSVVAVAVDACGRESAPAAIGAIHVPRDQSPRRRDCVEPGRIR